jgi:hypothetical protein
MPRLQPETNRKQGKIVGVKKIWELLNDSVDNNPE